MRGKAAEAIEPMDPGGVIARAVAQDGIGGKVFAQPHHHRAEVDAAGLLVGFGTRLGGGCTSGHGVCGIARLSPRSITATLVFMATAMVVVAIMRHGLGG